MFSIVRANYKNSNSIIESKVVDDDFMEPLKTRRLILIKKIDPEEFENQEVNNMVDDFELSEDDVDELEKEIPAEVDQVSMDDIDDPDDDLDYEELVNSVDTDDIEVSEDDIAELEKEIPAEADELEDADLENPDDED